MKLIEVEGRVDEAHRLTADVPAEVRPGTVTVRIAVADEADADDSDAEWSAGIAAARADAWTDPREDIYTADHGEPVHSLDEGHGRARQ